MIDDIRPPHKPPKRLTIEPPVHEKPFIPPEEVVDHEPSPVEPLQPAPKKKSRFSMREAKLRTRILALLGIVVLLAGGAFASWWFFFKPPPPPPPVVAATQPTPEPTPVAPTTVASPLTGVQVAPEIAARGVTGIMIENSPDARPQSGLKEAGVVFEAVAEGGITRFLTLRLEAQDAYIGPVRSVRPYYLDWLVPFGAPIAHAGGSPEALAQIKAQGIKDMDQFANSAYYQRVSSRYAPHNLYTSMAQLDALRAAKGWAPTPFTAWARKAEAPLKVPTAKTIDINISGPTYNPHYDYDPATNNYKRSQAGQPHIDEKGGQITPKVVVVLVVPRSLSSDGVHSVYATNGSGAMLVFQDGGVTTGTWSKASRGEQLVFKDSAGKALALDPGQTWVTMVNGLSFVTYAP